MVAIHINRRLDSELIPELHLLIGKRVRIVAEEEQDGEVGVVNVVFNDGFDEHAMRGQFVLASY